MSAGTALAAALRPLGLVLWPIAQADDTIELRIGPPSATSAAWPIGWPAEQAPPEAVPKLFEKLPVEINQTPLAEALAAIQHRLQIPVLVDHNGLAAAEIDPARIPVRFAAQRTTYQRVLDRVLFQGRLQSEVRMDEAKRPFLWISPIQPAAR
jgi:hypothetical protein